MFNQDNKSKFLVEQINFFLKSSQNLKSQFWVPNMDCFNVKLTKPITNVHQSILGYPITLNFEKS